MRDAPVPQPISTSPLEPSVSAARLTASRPNSTIHASAVLVGAKAVLIRGPSGAGKSRLAWDLLQAGQTGGALPFARLVADDRAYLEIHAGRLLVRPVSSLAGRLEVRGLGIRELAYEPVAVVGFVVDLAAEDGARLPEAAARETAICGITLPRLAVAAGFDALRLVLAFGKTGSACD